MHVANVTANRSEETATKAGSRTGLGLKKRGVVHPDMPGSRGELPE